MNDYELIRLPEVRRMLGGIPKRTVYDWLARGHFPPPIHLAGNTVAWRRRAITNWIDAREAMTA